MKKVVLLIGIHGVGKGYILHNIKNKINIPIYTASDLIRKTGRKSDFSKRVLNINKNQEILSFAIDSFVKEDKFILDGHTCLWNKNGEIEEIDFNNFKKIEIRAFIFIYDKEEIIRERLYKRNQLDYSSNSIKQFQKAEYNMAKRLSEQLCIPLFCFKNGNNLNKLIDYIQEIEAVL